MDRYEELSPAERKELLARWVQEQEERDELPEVPEDYPQDDIPW